MTEASQQTTQIVIGDEKWNSPFTVQEGYGDFTTPVFACDVSEDSSDSDAHCDSSDEESMSGSEEEEINAKNKCLTGHRRVVLGVTFGALVLGLICFLVCLCCGNCTTHGKTQGASKTHQVSGTTSQGAGPVEKATAKRGVEEGNEPAIDTSADSTNNTNGNMGTPKVATMRSPLSFADPTYEDHQWVRSDPIKHDEGTHCEVWTRWSWSGFSSQWEVIRAYAPGEDIGTYRQQGILSEQSHYVGRVHVYRSSDNLLMETYTGKFKFPGQELFFDAELPTVFGCPVYNGKGILHENPMSSTSVRYEGEFRDGLKSGIGKLTTFKNHIQTEFRAGSFKNGQQSGAGVQQQVTFESDGKYINEFVVTEFEHDGQNDNPSSWTVFSKSRGLLQADGKTYVPPRYSRSVEEDVRNHIRKTNYPFKNRLHKNAPDNSLNNALDVCLNFRWTSYRFPGSHIYELDQIFADGSFTNPVYRDSE